MCFQMGVFRLFEISPEYMHSTFKLIMVYDIKNSLDSLPVVLILAVNSFCVGKADPSVTLAHVLITVLGVLYTWG